MNDDKQEKADLEDENLEYADKEEFEEEIKVYFECRCRYSLSDMYDVISESGYAVVKICGENLEVIPETAVALTLPLIDTNQIFESKYKIYMNISSFDKLILSELGYNFEDFLHKLYKVRTDAILRYMLAEDKRILEIDCEFLHRSEDKNINESGKCFLYLYETYLIVVKAFVNPIKIPYSLICSMKDENYSILLEIDTSEQYSFIKLGKQFDVFKSTISKLMNDLTKKTQELLNSIIPGLSSTSIRRASALMKYGKAVSKLDVGQIPGGLWSRLENKLYELGKKENYDFLKAKGNPDKIWIGIKHELISGLKGEYLWYLIAIYSENTEKCGNIIAMEAASKDETGKATYFFRITERQEYNKSIKIEKLDIIAEKLIRNLNYCMLDINFRREPIYMSEELLDKQDKIKYKIPLKNLDSLKLLRAHFIGRVIHSSIEQWKRDVENLMNFNMTSNSDNKKWKK